VTTYPSLSPQRSTHDGDDGTLPLSLTADNRCMPHRHLLHLQIRTRTRCAFAFIFCMWVCFFFQPLAVWRLSPPVRDHLTHPSPRPVVAHSCAVPSRPPQLGPHPSSPPSFHPLARARVQTRTQAHFAFTFAFACEHSALPRTYGASPEHRFSLLWTIHPSNRDQYLISSP
jgi:hypothetical protein